MNNNKPEIEKGNVSSGKKHLSKRIHKNTVKTCIGLLKHLLGTWQDDQTTPHVGSNAPRKL